MEDVSSQKRGVCNWFSFIHCLGSNCLMQDWLQECVTHSHTPSASWHLGFSFMHTHLSCHRTQKGFDSATLPNITFISNESLLRGKKPLNFVHSYKGGEYLVNRKTDKADFDILSFIPCYLFVLLKMLFVISFKGFVHGLKYK